MPAAQVELSMGMSMDYQHAVSGRPSLRPARPSQLGPFPEYSARPLRPLPLTFRTSFVEVRFAEIITQHLMGIPQVNNPVKVQKSKYKLCISGKFQK